MACVLEGKCCGVQVGIYMSGFQGQKIQVCHLLTFQTQFSIFPHFRLWVVSCPSFLLLPLIFFFFTTLFFSSCLWQALHMTSSISKHLPSFWLLTVTVQPVLSIYDAILPTAYSSSTTLKKGAVGSSKMSVTNYQLTRCHMPKDCNLPYCRCHLLFLRQCM